MKPTRSVERRFIPVFGSRITVPDPNPRRHAEAREVGEFAVKQAILGTGNGAVAIQPHLMVTDPPYGVNYDADWRNSAQRAKGQPYGGRAVGKVTNDDCVDWRAAWRLFKGDVAYVWHGALHVAIMSCQLTECGFDLRALIVWAKNNFAVSRGHYHWQHETLWYAVRKGQTAHWSGDAVKPRCGTSISR